MQRMDSDSNTGNAARTGVHPADDIADFIRRHTIIENPPLIPELRLHLATEITPLWQATEAWLTEQGLPPPFWAFAWAGGQALARHILDHPELVAGRSVLDFAAGGGLVALAAARSGARSVSAAEIDPVACGAISLNAGLNGLSVTPFCRDIIGQPQPGLDVLLVGDVCYERPMAERIVAWLHTLSAAGVLVLMGDPGRTYLPTSGLKALARYTVPTSLELEDRTERLATVWQVE
jgi:predicted nicotinamide N-methyase